MVAVGATHLWIEMPSEIEGGIDEALRRMNDIRSVAPGTALGICADSAWVEVCRGLLDFLVVDVRTCAFSEKIRSCKLPIVLIGQIIDYDDDPHILSEQIDEMLSVATECLVVLSVVPSRISPRRWFEHEAGRYEEDLDSSDVQGICNRVSVLINVRMSVGDLPWFRVLFPSVAGFAFVIGDDGNAAKSPVRQQLNVILDVLKNGNPTA